MKYYQIVKINKTTFEEVVKAFSDINFIKFLTFIQPIKIIDWSGIKNKKIAFFKLWFLGWKNFKVIHSDYRLNKKQLSFIDQGVELPLGITDWNHKHIVKNNKTNILIIDSINIKHKNILIGYILFPILIFPIFIRKLLYKLYFKNK